MSLVTNIFVLCNLRTSPIHEKPYVTDFKYTISSAILYSHHRFMLVLHNLFTDS